MALTKKALREALSRLVGDWWPGTTVGAGNAGGTTALLTQYDGYGDSLFRGNWLLMTSGTNGGATPQYRLVSAMSGTAPATFTVTPAYGAQVANGVTVELHAIRPDWFTEALNRAVATTFPDLRSAGLDSSLSVAETLTVVSSSVAAATTITTSAAHHLVSGQTVTIAGHTGSTPAIDGNHIATVTGATTFTIPVNVTVGGTGGTAKALRYEFGLPSGVTPDQIVQVAMEGESDFDNIPYTIFKDVTFNHDGTIMWINRQPRAHMVDLIDGRKIYIMYNKYLTVLESDTTYGQLTTDTTTKVELTAGTNAYELYLQWAKCHLFEMLAAQPMNERKSEHLAMAKQSRDFAMAMMPTHKMQPLENPWTA